MTGYPSLRAVPAPRWLPPPHQLAVAAACGYEAVALCSAGKLPTISALQRRYRLVGIIVVSWLGWHFMRYPLKVLVEADSDLLRMPGSSQGNQRPQPVPAIHPP